MGLAIFLGGFGLGELLSGTAKVDLAFELYVLVLELGGVLLEGPDLAQEGVIRRLEG